MKSTIFLSIALLGLQSFSVQAQKDERPIVVQNLYYPKPGKADEVYSWRQHASDVRTSLGLPAGRVLKKISGDASYYVIWECDYPSIEAREADTKILDQSAEFTKVQEHMRTLIRKFERNIWEVGVRTGVDELQIREKRGASNLAIKAHDTIRIAKDWHKDITVVTSRNARFIGRKQNSEAFANEFKTKKGLYYERTASKIEVFKFGNMAAESGNWVGHWEDGSEPIELRGSYYAKWIKVGSEWLIRAEVYTVLACESDPWCEDLFR